MGSEEKISPDEFDQELEALMSGTKEPKKKKGGKKKKIAVSASSESPASNSCPAEKTWSRWWTP